jgi:hypothetical protein
MPTSKDDPLVLDDDDDHDEGQVGSGAGNGTTAAAAAAGTPLQDEISPPGMKRRLRSTGQPQTQKRRRSNEEGTSGSNSGSLPQKKKARVTKRGEEKDVAKDDDDDDDDDDLDEVFTDEEEQEDHDEDMEEQDVDKDADDGNDDRKIPAAQNGTNGNGNGNGSSSHTTTTTTYTQVPAATAAAAAAATTQATASQRVPPVSKLRMPSKHTPGKLKERETAVLPNEPPASLADNLPPPSRRLVFSNQKKPATNAADAVAATATAAAGELRPVNGDAPVGEEEQQVPVVAVVEAEAFHVKMFRSVREGIAQVMAAATAAAQVEPEVGDNEEKANHHKDLPHLVLQWLTISYVWFGIFLMLQVLFWPVWIHPILSTVVETSKEARVFYKGALNLGSPVAVVYENVNVTLAVVPVPDDPAASADLNDTNVTAVTAAELEDVTKMRKSKLAALANLQEALGKSKTELVDSVDLYKSEIDHLDKIIQAEKESISPKKADLVSTKAMLGTVLKQEDEYVVSSPLLPRIRDFLKPEDTFLLDLKEFDFSKIPDGDDCDGAFDKSINRSLLSTVANQTVEEADANMNAIIAKPETAGLVRAWLRKSPPVGAVAIPKRKIQAGGSSMSSIHMVVEGRLAVERADQTGNIDYAAIYNGAAVIRSGDRATTPALVNKLPLFNRIAALLSLRFYGHGAEIALTPTYPRDALGQCWAFEKASEKYSGFGTLSVRLAKPVFVTSISIEHPPKEVTDRVNTAIRSFRVFGFESPDAQGKAWPIGDFEYMIGEETRQEFDIEDEVANVDVPKLQSISIAVDSNWGTPYACLYRVRVFGGEDL